jgi:transposase
MAEDRNRYKIAYWHRSHQLPGAWVCTKHTGQMLIESRLKSSGSQRFGWILPEELHFRPVAQRPSESAILNLQCLADAANELARIEIGWHFDPAIFTDTILARLQQKGLASTSFRLKTNDIGSQFHEYISAFHGIEEFQAITGDEARTTAQATAYLRRIARITHPLRHLVMIAWLYPDWGTFFEDYKARTNQFLSKEFPSSDGETAIKLKTPSIDFDLRDSCVRLSTTELLTATAIANRLDVTVTTVIAHLAAAGIRTPKRPKVLRGKKHSELLAALRDGISKQEAAEKIGASIGTVTRFLLSEVGLHQEWTQARDKLIREKMRLRWKALVSGNLTSAQKFLRAIEPGTYAWLYRNDREWLRTSSQGSNINPRPGGRSVDWAARDEQMSLILGAAIRELVSNSRGRHIHLTELISHATQLKPYINKMDALPRTHLMLKQFMKNSLVRKPDFFE